MKTTMQSTAIALLIGLAGPQVLASEISFSSSTNYSFERTFTGTSGQNVLDNVLLTSAEVQLPQFDPALGTLEDVQVTMQVDASTDIYFAILSSTSNFSSSAGYVSRYRSPGLISAPAADGNTSDVGPDGVFSGPTSLTYFGYDSGVDSGTDFSFTGTGVAPFEGTGDISYFFDTYSFIAINANSNIGLFGTVQERIEGNGTGIATVRYSYTEAVPEPGALALAALAGAFLLTTRDRARWA